MKVVQQKLALPIKNIDLNDGEDKSMQYRKHSTLLPNNVRCIICGPSGVGKTNVIINLLESPNGLRFENIYIYSRSLFQPKYLYLKEIVSGIKGMGFYLFSSSDEVIPIEDVKPNSVFIFDDVICDKQHNMRAYFCMGRHKGVDLFYLTQSYAHIPKHLIRENANLIVLFRQDDMNLRHIFNDFGIAGDMSFNQFKEMCAKCWNNSGNGKHRFLVIDLESSKDNGKYIMQFDKFIIF